jgi:hypothetical protein
MIEKEAEGAAIVASLPLNHSQFSPTAKREKQAANFALHGALLQDAD